MKTIKESKSVTYTEDVHPVVEQMEKEWPEMTKEVHLALTGLWFRMNDKIQRLKTMLLSRRESAVDEPMEDAYLDVSNYGIMATIVKNGKWGK